MQEFLKLLPKPPVFAYDWEGIMKSPAGGFMKALYKTMQNPEWHGEGDVFSHTKMVCECLCGMEEFRRLPERQRNALSLAALLHDIGKIPTTTLEDGVWRSMNHSVVGESMAREFLWKTLSMCGSGEKACLRECVCLLIRNHMLPARIAEKSNAEERLKKLAANGFTVKGFSLELLFLLALADAKGRIAPDTDSLVQAVGMFRELSEEYGLFQTCPSFENDYVRRMYFKGKSLWPGMAEYADVWDEVILLSALPGTGKDTWLKANYPHYPVVSLDALREEMDISPTDEQGRVIQAAKEKAREYLRKRQPFCWNATNLTYETRAKLISLFEDYGANVRIVYLETDWTENLSRNAGRKACVPELVIERMLSKLTPPMAFEAGKVEWLFV